MCTYYSKMYRLVNYLSSILGGIIAVIVKCDLSSKVTENMYFDSLEK